MEQNNFPPLYIIADLKSIKQQQSHFNSLRTQLAFLFIASLITVLSFDNLPFSVEKPSWVYLYCISISMIFMCYSALLKLEKTWYESRALAESTNTLTWRFIMGAEPFSLSPRYTEEHIDSVFSSYLKELWDKNKMNDKKIDKTLREDPQITDWMKKIRQLDFKKKRNHYLHLRIEDQLNWYKKKTQSNKNKSILFFIISVISYGGAITIALSQCIKIGLSFPQWSSEPILVVAAGLVGWTQAKRYSELASSYALTSREILGIKDDIKKITEEQFSNFVNGSERAFSREHTQWVARRLDYSSGEEGDTP